METRYVNTPKNFHKNVSLLRLQYKLCNNVSHLINESSRSKILSPTANKATTPGLNVYIMKSSMEPMEEEEMGSTIKKISKVITDEEKAMGRKLPIELMGDTITGTVKVNHPFGFMFDPYLLGIYLSIMNSHQLK